MTDDLTCPICAAIGNTSSSESGILPEKRRFPMRDLLWIVLVVVIILVLVGLIRR